MKEQRILNEQELFKFLEENLYIKDRGTAHKLTQVENNIVNSIEVGKKRFKKLLAQIDVSFPPETTIRGAVDGLTYYLFDNAFTLYFVGSNSALFVELQGLLERFCGNKVTEFLAVNDKSKEILDDAFEKKTLTDFAEYFKTISYWDNEDVSFAKKLTNIRNGIAHKNAKRLSKYFHDGNLKTLSELETLIREIDMIPYIIQTVNLIIKVTDTNKPYYLQNPRFEARLEAYSSISGMITNLFCDPEYIHLPRHIKFVLLNRLFARTTLLSSDKLRGLLNNYKDKVIDFHEQLNKNEIKMKQLWNDLVLLVAEIIEEMRANLNVDGDSHIFQVPLVTRLEEIIEKRGT